MVLIIGGKVIVATPMNADQGNFMRTDSLQFFTLRNGNQPVFSAMYNIGMAIHLSDPLIRSKFIS
jgi:hypothetical protein